jgi:hypothetical protein
LLCVLGREGDLDTSVSGREDVYRHVPHLGVARDWCRIASDKKQAESGREGWVGEPYRHPPILTRTASPRASFRWASSEEVRSCSPTG